MARNVYVVRTGVFQPAPAEHVSTVPTCTAPCQRSRAVEAGRGAEGGASLPRTNDSTSGARSEEAIASPPGGHPAARSVSITPIRTGDAPCVTTPAPLSPLQAAA